MAEWRGDVRLNGDTLEALVRARLISLPQLDAQLALAMEAGNYSSVFLVMQLLQVREITTVICDALSFCFVMACRVP